MGERWLSAAVVAARAAASLLDCLQGVDLGDFEASMIECMYGADLFAAALGEENRLGVEFQRAYFAYLDP